MSTSDNSDLMAMAISFAWFTAAAWVTLGSDVISRLFKLKQDSLQFHFIGAILMSVLIVMYYNRIQAEEKARAENI
jgi:hypothetical protein